MNSNSDTNFSSVEGIINDDWSFEELKTSETLWGPHGYHRYPAKFIPQLVRRIIDKYSNPEDMVCDSFLGSATTGVEAIRAKRKFFGADINPVALLISQVKCNPIPPEELSHAWLEVQKAIVSVPKVGRRKLNNHEKELIKSTKIASATPDERLKYWFPAPYYQALETLLELLLEHESLNTRLFFLCAFSNILRRCSIWLSGSTKPQKDINKYLNDPFESFHQQVKRMMKGNKLYWDDLTQNNISVADVQETYALALGNAQSLPLQTGSVDLLVTSPPYATCYEYIQLHQLTQLWFDKKGLFTNNDWRGESIGSKILHNGHVESDTSSSIGSKAAENMIEALVELSRTSVGSPAAREARALTRYFKDMNIVLAECARVVCQGKFLVLVIGDSKRRGLEVPTSAALCEMAIDYGFVLHERIVRKVAGRILVSTRDEKTGRFSSRKNSNSYAYPKENILVFKKH